MHLTGDQLTTDEDIPWGADAMITLNYVDGRYALQAFDGRFLSESSQLIKKLDDSCKFVLVFYQEKVALLSNSGSKMITVGDCLIL